MHRAKHVLIRECTYVAEKHDGARWKSRWPLLAAYDLMPSTEVVQRGHGQVGLAVAGRSGYDDVTASLQCRPYRCGEGVGYVEPVPDRGRPPISEDRAALEEISEVAVCDAIGEGDRDRHSF